MSESGFAFQVNFASLRFRGCNVSLIVSLFGIANAVARIASGRLVDRTNLNPVRMQQTFLFLAGLSTTLIPLAPNFYVILFISTVVGAADGVYFCLCGPIAFRLLGEEDAAQGICNLLSLMALSVVIGPPLAGTYVAFGSLLLPFAII